MKFGFLGTGTITSAIIEGMSATMPETPITVSPRNAEVAAGLARRFANVTVASSNQAVLDASDIVVLAIRPQIMKEVLPALRFQPNHNVISLIAAVSLADLHAAVAPATLLTRAVPLPSVARLQGPTAMFPPNPFVRSLFDGLGTAIALNDETEFEAFTTATAVMASYFGFVGTVASWMERQGVAPANARAYLSQMMLGLAGAAPASPGRSFAELATEHQSRGGLNEQVLQSITSNGALTALDRALDAVMRRLRPEAEEAPAAARRSRD